MDSITISLPLAFLAGLVSFLSPCVLPLVPSYIVFVSGMSLEELSDGTRTDARWAAAFHAAMFGIGFLIVFMTLGAAATAAGQTLNRFLPIMGRLGGGLVILFGLYLTGVLRLPVMAREWRMHLAKKPTSALGSVAVGIVFGAGWTPCIGPILASILFYAASESTVLQGTTLLGVYGLGMALPFFLVAVGFNWFLTSMEAMQRWVGPLQKTAGILLVVIGILLLTGSFASISSRLADLGQWIDLEIQ
ncbi:MAG: cytochrome c biogenesis protein CcdA [Gemmatimonadota bacterium]|nr:MAG: cytochrome c biogenesis protein CcdA [Gemmatimonadota bacterium]